jgi:hypothetical protein
MDVRHIKFVAAVVAALVMWFSADAAVARVDVEAIPGSPFGVGRMTVPLRLADVDAAVDSNGFALVEEDGRVLYPAFTTGRIGKFIGQLLGTGDLPPTSVTVYFLFTGDRPLKLTLYTPAAHTTTAVPVPQQPRQYSRLLQDWWREYNAAARQQITDGDYPPLVETYLTTMLGKRLGFPPPLADRGTEKKPDETQQALDLLLGTESLHLATMRETIMGRGAIEAANQPLPADVAWRGLPLPPVPTDVIIEPMAAHVPEECFYVRFGRFSNYLWMDNLLEDYGGDVGSMITLRGASTDLNGRMQRQLALEKNVLADLLGDTVIADVAIIGRDTHTDLGAAIGMLFQARNAVLAQDFAQQRARALAREKPNGATNVTVKIAGRDVSLLSTPDNRLRSFYAVDGDFHLVTTSRAIVERFFDAGAGRGSLAASPEFRHARTVMPVSREDTIFVYFSSAFFRGLVSPQYQIELARRMQSVTDIELLHMARLAARAEKQPGDTIDDLIRAGLLPRGFGQRPDGSRPVISDNAIVDSLRGPRGSFIPIPDVELTGVTRSEASQYAARAAFYRDNWKQMDPLMAGVKRLARDRTGGERLVIDAQIAPLDESKYGWVMSLLGPPSNRRVAPVPGDVISIQTVVKGGMFAPSIPVHHLFVGVQDMASNGDVRSSGFLRTLQILQNTPGYLGALPGPGFLDLLPGLLASERDVYGFTALPLGLWRRDAGGFSMLSFDKRLLADVTPHLRLEETDTEAQVRVHVGDLSQSKLSGWISTLMADRARQASLGNARLLHALSQQLHVPREDALNTAEHLLDAKLVCPLGGEYQLAESPGSIGLWQSTRWSAADSTEPREPYSPLLLEWFRGLDARMTKSDGRLVVHAELDMQRKPSASKFELPLFNLFGGSKAPGKDEDKKPATEAKPLAPDSPKAGSREF